MRRLVVKETIAFAALGDRLAGVKGGAGPERAAATLATLRQFNPHVVDTESIPVGTVLLIPDDVAVAPEDAESIGGQTFGEFAGLANVAIEASAARVGAGHEALAAEQKEVLAALKTKDVRQQLESDTDLAKLVKAADAVFKEDQRNAKESQQTMKRFRDEMAQEIALLGKLVG